MTKKVQKIDLLDKQEKQECKPKVIFGSKFGEQKITSERLQITRIETYQLGRLFLPHMTWYWDRSRDW